MKICLAQIRSGQGDIPGNLLQHQKWIECAVTQGADVIVFPELSLTGYEPQMAQTLATQPEDSRFDVWQTWADTGPITIVAGVPLQAEGGVCIGLVIFQPGQPRQSYAKQYLHPDEEPFFVRGRESPGLIHHHNTLALAICYELSVPAHAERASQNGADIYMASVAKSATGVLTAQQRLAEIARHYGIPVLMVNGIGPSDDFISAGQTAVWNADGVLIGQLDDKHEGLLLFDTTLCLTRIHPC